jgi:hypothetical protein
MLHRHLRHEQVVAGLAAALNAGALTADAVALEARKHDETSDDLAIEPSTGQPAPPQAVRSLTEHRLRAQLPADDRALPTVDKYDQLLPSRRETRTKEPHRDHQTPWNDRGGRRRRNRPGMPDAEDAHHPELLH